MKSFSFRHALVAQPRICGYCPPWCPTAMKILRSLSNQCLKFLDAASFGTFQLYSWLRIRTPRFRNFLRITTWTVRVHSDSTSPRNTFILLVQHKRINYSIFRGDCKLQGTNFQLDRLVGSSHDDEVLLCFARLMVDGCTSGWANLLSTP